MILLTGAKLTTAEAFAFGMVDRVVADQTALGLAIAALSEPAKTAKAGLLAQIKAMI